MATHDLNLDTDYNVAVNTSGAGKFNEDKGVPDQALDPTSDHSVSNKAVCAGLDEKTTVREVTALPTTAIKSDCFYRVTGADRLMWYDPVNLGWIDLTAAKDPYAIEERTEDFKKYIGTYISYASLPAAASYTGKVAYTIAEASFFESDSVTWQAATDTYTQYEYDHFYKRANVDDVYWWMPASNTWISILNGTGTGEPNIINSISVNGTPLTITSKDADASALANKIESISVNGVAQTIDVNKNVNLTTSGEANKIEKILRNNVELPITSKTVNIAVNDDAEENVIEGVRYNGTLVNIDTDKIANITGAGEENIIKTISVNGVNCPPDAAKNVNISMSSFISAERGLSINTSGIGHSNSAISPLTTQKLATVALDQYGHITAYTTKDIGNGLSDIGNTIGHGNSTTAQTTKALRSFSYDGYGHVLASDVIAVTDGLVSSSNKIGHSNTVTEATAKSVRSFSYDANGHITSDTVIGFDSTPKASSSNLMTSGAIYNVIGDIAVVLAALNDGAGV